ncbi:Arm DNA-binding domain-containing protein [Parabacteroides johnsonii]|uniref:Arm DNA-binding domain-containing protein n=1 Tax=Parabacteroides johnsonii TaxID=387661 RepID=UPI00241F7C10|nr:Arm DNA-binding domain-containing protein [Parabacteroides johnsonii]
MATIRTKFRSSSRKAGRATVYQVIHNRVVRQISTGYKLFASEWDQRFRSGHSLSTPCRDGTGQLSSIGRGTDKTGQNPTGKGYQDIKPIGPFTADDIVIRFHDSGQEPSFNDYLSGNR